MSAIDEIRNRAAAATPGPWGWFGHASGGMYLATQRWGRYYIMSARRQGMQGAQFEFQDVNIIDPDGEWKVDRRDDEFRNGIRKASDLAVFQVCPSATDANDPRVYRDDIIGFRSTNATFIANARQDVTDLLAYIDELEALLALQEAA